MVIKMILKYTITEPITVKNYLKDVISSNLLQQLNFLKKLPEIDINGTVFAVF